VNFEIVVEDPTGKSDSPALFGLAPGKEGGNWLLPALLLVLTGMIAGLVVYLVLSRRRPEPAPQGKL